MAIATARPTPIDLMITTCASPKAMKTVHMMAAAPVISRPLFSSPMATPAWLSPSRRYSS